MHFQFYIKGKVLTYSATTLHKNNLVILTDRLTVEVHHREEDDHLQIVTYSESFLATVDVWGLSDNYYSI